MKLLAYMKLSIKGVFKQLPLIILTYVAFPIILALLVGYIQLDSSSPTINQAIFSIKILDEDNTQESKELISYLESGNVSKLIKIEKDSDDLDYTVKIPKGYSIGLNGDKDIDIKIEAREDSSTSKGNMLVSLIDNYNKELTKSILIEKNMEDLDLKTGEINTIITNTYSMDSINTKIHRGEKTLSSYEYFSISFLGYVFILFIIAIITAENMGKEIGIYNRIISTGVTKLEYFNLELISNYFMMIVINAMYIFSFRILKLSFDGSLLILCLIILLQSLVITLVGSFIANIFTKKYALMFTQAYLMFHTIFGGIIGTPKALMDIKIFEFFSKYKPDKIIGDIYRNYIIYNDLSYISRDLLAVVIFSIGMYLINIIAVKREWGLR